MFSTHDIWPFYIPQIICTGCVFHELQCPESKRLILFTYKGVPGSIPCDDNVKKMTVLNRICFTFIISTSTCQIILIPQLYYSKAINVLYNALTNPTNGRLEIITQERFFYYDKIIFLSSMKYIRIIYVNLQKRQFWETNTKVGWFCNIQIYNIF